MATVDELIDDARGYAQSLQNTAAEMVGQATAAIGQLGAPFVVSGPAFEDQPQVVFPDAVPEFTVQAFDAGTAPAAPGPNDLVNLPTLEITAQPVLTATDPGFTDPSKPAPLGAFTTQAPVIRTDFVFPDVPPQLQEINILPPDLPVRTEPAKPEYQLPVFDAQAPADIPNPPTDYDEKFVKAYRDAAPTMMASLEGQMDGFLRRINPQFFDQMARLEGKLTTYIEGGTALSPAIENAIAARAADKINGEYRRAHAAAYQDAARRGFTLPDGVLNSNAMQARQAGADNNARAAMDIAIKQAELEQQNIQFAITTSTQLRNIALSTALNYHGNLVTLNGQAVQYAQAVLNAAVAVYDAMVKAYAARLDAYRAEAMVYQTRMQAVQVLAEIYQSEVNALVALTQADNAKVSLYRARLEALDTLAKIYRDQIEVVQAQANIEKTKIELYGSQVQAFGTMAQAKSAEWSGYSAAVGGQEARIRAYTERVRAYSAQVDAWKATIDAQQAKINSYAKFNEDKMRIYTAEVEGYRAKVGAQATVASTLLENQRTKLMSYTAKISSSEAQARLAQQYYATRAQISDSEFRTVSQLAIQNAELNTKQIQSVAQTALSGADVYSRMAQSALAGMNTLVSSSESTST
jgi:hypothetical protein